MSSRERYSKTPHILSRATNISSAAYRIFGYLQSLNPSHPSYDEIHEVTGFSDKVIRAANKELVGLQMIWYEPGSFHGKKANQYHVRPVEDWLLIERTDRPSASPTEAISPESSLPPGKPAASITEAEQDSSWLPYDKPIASLEEATRLPVGKYKKTNSVSNPGTDRPTQSRSESQEPEGRTSNRREEPYSPELAALLNDIFSSIRPKRHYFEPVGNLIRDYISEYGPGLIELDQLSLLIGKKFDGKKGKEVFSKFRKVIELTYEEGKIAFAARRVAPIQRKSEKTPEDELERLKGQLERGELLMESDEELRKRLFEERRNHPLFREIFGSEEAIQESLEKTYAETKRP